MDAQASDLELHPEAARERQDTYSSFTDLEEIDIFTDEFRSTLIKVQGEQKGQAWRIKEKVFTKNYNEKASGDDELTARLFASHEKTVLQHDYQERHREYSLVDAGFVLIAALTVAALYLFFFQDKKRRGRKG